MISSVCVTVITELVGDGFNRVSYTAWKSAAVVAKLFTLKQSMSDQVNFQGTLLNRQKDSASPRAIIFQFFFKYWHEAYIL